METARRFKKVSLKHTVGIIWETHPNLKTELLLRNL